VQDIMALRFSNAIFEPVWNRRYVDSVQITAAETVGVETAAVTTRTRARCAT
jgi:glucose-6-phosphate 1-dehydrogenase